MGKSFFRSCASFAAGLGALFGFGAAGPGLGVPAMAADTLTIASFGGVLDTHYKIIFKPFEESRKVEIRWIPGTAAGNVAKLAATKDAPEFDLVLSENFSFRQGAQQGLFAPIDESIVTNFKDVSPLAKPKTKDGVGIGFLFQGVFYREDELGKRGIAPPRGWADLTRPEFCNIVGMMDPNVVTTLHAMLALSGGKASNIDQGIATLAKLKNCVPVLEPSSSALEDKVSRGTYLVGGHNSIRIIPMTKSGMAIRFVVPEEGSIISYSAISVAKNSANAKLAQEFINFFLSPEAQKGLMEMLFYLPVNTKVAVPTDLQKLGLPSPKALENVIAVDEDEITANRREWNQKVNRAFSR